MVASLCKADITKVFVAIDDHVGETVEAVIDPRDVFDVTYSFEPVTACCDRRSDRKSVV